MGNIITSICDFINTSTDFPEENLSEQILATYEDQNQTFRSNLRTNYDLI